MKRYLILIAFFALTATFAVNAQSQTRRADKRETAQRVRIHEGRKSGELTNGEAAALNAEQRHVRRSERRAKADGEVTPREKARLEREQNRANRHIRRAKHNEREK